MENANQNQTFNREKKRKTTRSRSRKKDSRKNDNDQEKEGRKLKTPIIIKHSALFFSYIWSNRQMTKTIQVAESEID